MGAVIGMRNITSDRKKLIDIGAAGPLAGLAVAIPVILYGVARVACTYNEMPPSVKSEKYQWEPGEWAHRVKLADYFKGLGVQKDYGEAFKWYRRAADQGLGVAQYNLGAMYAKGEAVTQDVVTAHLLYGLAATSGIKAAGAAKNPCCHP